MKKVNVVGVGVSNTNIPEAVDTVGQYITEGGSHYVCVCTVYALMMCQTDEEYLRIHNEADIVTPDGRPLGWVQTLRGYPQHERVYGPDLMLACCKHGVEKGWKHYFGGKPGVAEYLKETLTARFPGLQVVGCYTPPVFPSPPDVDEAEVRHINESGADIVWVGLGSPRQELWMGRHVKQVKAPVMAGVGAAFDFHTGAVKQAPAWMQRRGLEWLFRMCMEPRRLWKRYLINNPKFMYLAACQLSGLKKFPLDTAL